MPGQVAECLGHEGTQWLVKRIPRLISRSPALRLTQLELLRCASPRRTVLAFKPTHPNCLLTQASHILQSSQYNRALNGEL